MSMHDNKPIIMIVTTGRADYGLLYPLILKINQSHVLSLQLVATGSHLSKQHGETVYLIKEDGLSVDHKVVMTQDADNEHAVCASIADGLNGFSCLFESSRPNLIVVLGDRYELLSIGIAALIHKIPVAHLHGGEATFGIIDEAVRHSITKIAVLHFPSIQPYANRIIQLGERPENVHPVGALGIDNINSMQLLEMGDLSIKLGIDFERPVALVTYHPVTLDSYDSALEQMRELLDALVASSIVSLITMPNSDTGYSSILDLIVEYSARYPGKIVFRKSLGQLNYLSAMKYAALMIGNSSSGIIESASFKLPVVNVGDRQSGRCKPVNIIDVDCKKADIVAAINKAMSDTFKRFIADLSNPYGDGNAAEKITHFLEKLDYEQLPHFIKKQFFDLASESSQWQIEQGAL